MTLEVIHTEENVIDDAREREEIELAKNKQLAKTMGADTTSDDSAHAQTDSVQASLEDRIRELTERNEKLQKNLDRTNGRYGQEIQSLRSKVESLAPVQEFMRAFSEVDPDDPEFDNLNSDLPDVASRFVKGFKGSVARRAKGVPQQNTDAQNHVTFERQDQAAPQQSAQSQAVNNVIQPDEFNMELALERLSEKHPDFREIAEYDEVEVASGFKKPSWKNPQFGQWIEQQSDDIRNLIIHGNKPAEILKIAKVLSEFKSASTDAKRPATVATVTPIRPDLSRSLLPDGRAAAKTISLTEEQVIEAAKQATMKRIMSGG